MVIGDNGELTLQKLKDSVVEFEKLEGRVADLEDHEFDDRLKALEADESYKKALLGEVTVNLAETRALRARFEEFAPRISSCLAETMITSNKVDGLGEKVLMLQGALMKPPRESRRRSKPKPQKRKKKNG